MGESKRKKVTAVKLSAGWVTGVEIIAVVIIVVFPTVLVWYLLSRDASTVQVDQPDSQPAVVASKALVEPSKSQRKRVVIDTSEGFVKLAQQLDASRQPFDWEQATVYWKGAVGKDPKNYAAWKGYARNTIRVLLQKNKMQPSRHFPQNALQEARYACGGFLRRVPQDPLAHELSAYCEALHGNQQGAIIHASKADFAARKAGMVNKDHELMSRVIMISSQRRNRSGMGIPGLPR